VDEELRALRPLQKRNLVPTTRVAPLERERLRLAGIIEGGSVQARKVQERLDEVTLRRQQIIQDYRQEASTLLLDVRQKLNEVQQQRLLIGDSQRRAEIRAPIAGVVQQLRVFTVGGVIRPGDAILDIAPENDELVIRAKVQPNDSDRVLSGMTAEVRFPAFSYWGQKAIHGKVRSISGDRIVDDQARETYFSAEILVDKTTVPQNILARLSAGMSADVLITSGERTVAEYLLQPITARFDKGLRER
jgi:HlyD family secretion protein